LNIDSDGDGKPDLNIDTDHDGKPDLNLVLLKKTDWKPTKCVKKDITQGILEEYCTGTTVKPTINIDLNSNHIPDINIDTNGDMKADINISKDGKNAVMNRVKVTNWLPDKDYTHQGFTYDTMKDLIPLLNVDSDGDGRPDINLDIDGDDIPDLNIDVNHDGIPDINIDSTGDGKADINVDVNGDGKADENIVSIKEWKPERNVDGDFPYDTMNIDAPTEPSNPDDSQEPNQKDNNSSGSVQGYYKPQESMGGASTGDRSNSMIYLKISLLSLGVLFLMKYKKKTES